MSLHNRELGQFGERLAEAYLVRQGAQILTRNYRINYGEIDLVLEHDGNLVAVEVKTRTEDDLEKPEEAVTYRQLRRIVQALTTYAADVDRLESPWRIDVVAIEVDADQGVTRLEHLRSVYPA